MIGCLRKQNRNNFLHKADKYENGRNLAQWRKSAPFRTALTDRERKIERGRINFSESRHDQEAFRKSKFEDSFKTTVIGTKRWLIQVISTSFRKMHPDAFFFLIFLQYQLSYQSHLFCPLRITFFFSFFSFSIFAKYIPLPICSCIQKNTRSKYFSVLSDPMGCTYPHNCPLTFFRNHTIHFRCFNEFSASFAELPCFLDHFLTFLLLSFCSESLLTQCSLAQCAPRRAMETKSTERRRASTDPFSYTPSSDWVVAYFPLFTCCLFFHCVSTLYAICNRYSPDIIDIINPSAYSDSCRSMQNFTEGPPVLAFPFLFAS